MQQFIQTANQYGKERVPFFFLIDFEKQKPIIFPLAEILERGLQFDFNKQNKFIQPLKINGNFELEIIPIHFNQYQKAFELVQRQTWRISLKPKLKLMVAHNSAATAIRH